MGVGVAIGAVLMKDLRCPKESTLHTSAYRVRYGVDEVSECFLRLRRYRVQSWFVHRQGHSPAGAAAITREKEGGGVAGGEREGWAVVGGKRDDG